MQRVIFILILLPMLGFAQYPNDIKSDFNWLFGYGSQPIRPSGGSLLNYNGIAFDTSWFNHNQIWLRETNTSQSDKDGNLIYYFDGYHVVGANHQLLPNGDSLNCCEDDFLNTYPQGQIAIQGAISMPFINIDNELLSKYYLFHRPFNFQNGNPVHYESRYSIVNKSNESYQVSQIDVPFFSDTLSYGNITAVRHANGRDWWVIQKKRNKNKYFVFLVSPDTVKLVHSLTKGYFNKLIFGQYNFTPDGTKYIQAGLDDYINEYKMHIQIFDFDRCTGLLGNPIHIEFPDSSGSVSSSAAISPNSRFLYLANRFKIWQFDLQAPDILASKTTVAEYDGFIDNSGGLPFGTTFVWMQLAPDNKIYICGGNTTYLHTIDNPDEQGLACSVNQHSFKMPTLNAYSMPNFPNFRLGPIDGSACDTLGIDNLTNINDKLDNNTEPVKIYPNPASDYITLFVPRLTKAWEFALYDITGKEVFKNQSRGAFRSYNINHLAQGMYLWKLVYEDGKVENGKMVKQ